MNLDGVPVLDYSAGVPHRSDAMRPSIALQQHRDEIRRIALSHHVANVRVFGSALRGAAKILKTATLIC